jgi:hypothetical protein
LIAALSLVLAGVTSGFREIPPRIALHVSPRDARLSLPTGATDVCVWRGFRGTIMYNFAIDEAGFWEWTRSIHGSLESRAAGVAIQPIAFSVAIRTYSEATGDIDAQTIRRGWFYDWQVEDRGLYYAYDADAGRAYYYSHAN